MVNLAFAILGQKLTLLTPTRFVSGTLNATTARFDFHSSEWDEAGKTVYFKNYDTEEELSFVLINDGITTDRGLDFAPGVWSVYLVGEIREGEEVLNRFTTESVTFKVVAPD